MLLHLLFETGRCPMEHNRYSYRTSGIDSAWLEHTSYAKQVSDRDLVLEPVIIMASATKGGEGQAIMSLHPIPRRTVSPIKIFWQKMKGKPAGEPVHFGIDSFHINVFDPLYVKAAQGMARGLSRLTKKPVKVKYEEWRGYNQNKPVEARAAAERMRKLRTLP